MEYISLIIAAISTLIEKFYKFDENRKVKKFFFWLSIVSFIVGIYQVYDKNKESNIEKVTLNNRHLQDSLYLNHILDNQNFQKRMQLDSFEKILKKEYLLLEEIKLLNQQSSSLQQELKLQSLEFEKSKYLITDDFYCYFGVTIPLIENNLHSMDNRLLNYLERSGFYSLPIVRPDRVNIFQERIFSNDFFSKFFDVLLNISVKKENKKILDLAATDIIVFNTNYQSLAFEDKKSLNLSLEYSPDKHEIYLEGRVPLKIIYQNYKYNSIKDFFNSELSIRFSIGNIVNSEFYQNNTSYQGFTNRESLGHSTRKMVLKYNSFKIKINAKKIYLFILLI